MIAGTDVSEVQFTSLRSYEYRVALLNPLPSNQHIFTFVKSTHTSFVAIHQLLRLSYHITTLAQLHLLYQLQAFTP